MGELSREHLEHIGRVEVRIYFTAVDLNPDEITQLLHIGPEFQAIKGQEKRNAIGKVVDHFEEGVWMISSKDKLRSKDLNDHFRHILDQVHPRRNEILPLISRQSGEIYFDVLWESSYLYAGTGPILSGSVIKQCGELNASIGFDIYQINN